MVDQDSPKQISQPFVNGGTLVMMPKPEVRRLRRASGGSYGQPQSRRLARQWTARVDRCPWEVRTAVRVDPRCQLGRRSTHHCKSTLRPRSVGGGEGAISRRARPRSRPALEQGIVKPRRGRSIVLSRSGRMSPKKVSFSSSGSVLDSPVAPARPGISACPATVNGQQRTDPDSGPRPDVGIHWE